MNENDLSWGFQLNLSPGARSRAVRVFAISISNSGNRAELRLMGFSSWEHEGMTWERLSGFSGLAQKGYPKPGDEFSIAGKLRC